MGFSMVKKVIKYMILGTLIVVIGISIYRNHYNQECAIKNARKFLEQNRRDIELIVHYLKAKEQDYLYISKNDGTVFYDFEYHTLPDEVKGSIKALWKKGCISIHKENEFDQNTINFEIWRHRGSEYGIACTINGDGVPDALFQIECQKIDDEWFYYYSNYEKYRILNDPYKSIR